MKKKKEITIEDLGIMITKGFEGVDKKFTEVDKKLKNIDKRFDKLENRMDSLKKGQKKIEKILIDIQDQIKIQFNRHNVLEERVIRLEKARMEEIQSQV